MDSREKFLIVIVGPTAIGKTALSITLAQQYHCDILSCDSRQFFKEMTIGTAVPDEMELAAAKHHFVHNKSVFDSYTVGDYEKEAIATLDKLYKYNDIAIVVGGSGLYVDAILKGFDDFPEIDAAVRAEINAHFETHGIKWLQEELNHRDPNYMAVVDVGNPQRMMRALEICIGTGKPYASFLNQKKNSRRFTPIIIGLEAERPILYDRINQRVDLMMHSGLLEEAQSLYVNKELNALQTVGYRELFTYFDGDFTLPFAVSEIKKNTRRFAKRQMTWFKRNESIKWFDFENPKQTVIDYINSVLEIK